MPWTQKQMLRDANGDLIPQYWDVVEQEFKPLTGSDGANDVRLTGSKVEQRELLARSVYRESQTNTFTVPRGVKGAFFSLRSHGATGVFNENEGIRVGVRLGSRQWYSVYIATEWRATNTSTSEILIYPGIDLGDAEEAYGTVSFAISKLNLQWATQGRWYVDIRGQIGEDEGFDAELFVKWIY